MKSGAGRRKTSESMEARSLEIGAALDRAYAQPDAAAVTHHFDRDFDASGTASPHSSVQIRERTHRSLAD
jgi:hypothetical protein